MSIVLQVESVSKYFSSEPILDRVTFDIRDTEHIALIGPNGAGKTTLLKILMQELDPDRGQVSLSKQATIGVLRQRHDLPAKQTLIESARESMASVVALIESANELASKMAEASDAGVRDSLAKRYDDLQLEINQRDGYQIDNKIERVLNGLGFPEADYEKDVNQLSGGQLNRLMLARLLLEEPTLMLLDEPSNHLDIESTEWLEEFLKASRQAFLLVSHDRYFLDRVANQTLELVNAKIDKYPGNYSKYLVLKEQRLDVERKTYDKQQTEIEKLEDFIRRNHHGLKHAQAEDRRKKLERIERVELPREIHTAPMKFAQASRTGDIVMRCNDIQKSFGNDLLFENVEFQVERGECWGILGPNGCGKSTLLKCLLGREEKKGEVKIGEGVKIGYFDQNLDSVPDDETAADAIRPGHKQMVDQERRDLLAKFGIDGDMALQKVRSFSGGERNRVALAFLAAQDANFLVLDEPTNHLDLWARHSLESALKKFDGTILMVSHDRYFINELCDHLLVFEGNRVFAFEGTYSEYRHMAALAKKEETAALQPFKADKKKRERQEKNHAKRKRQFPYRKVKDIEADIKSNEQRIEELHFELANPEVLRDPLQVKSVKSELADINDKLLSLYVHWEEAIELN